MRTTATPTARRTRSITRRGLALAVGAALAVSACGGSDDNSSDGEEGTGAPTTIDPQPADTDQAEGEESEAEVPAGPAAVRPVSVSGAPLSPLASDGVDPTVGTAAPVVTGATFDGDARVLGGSTGSPTMLVFLAHWCPACNAEVPELVSLADGGLPADLQVVGVSTAVASDRDNYPPYEWLDSFGWPYDTFADDEVSTAFQAFGGTAFPFAVVLDGDGNVLARKPGQSSAADIAAFVESVLG